MTTTSSRIATPVLRGAAVAVEVLICVLLI
jgi:hypothetical protein